MSRADEDSCAMTGALFFIVLAFFVGTLVGRSFGEKNVERQAIERGVAIYHPQTAVFSWTVTNNIAENP